MIKLTAIVAKPLNIAAMWKPLERGMAETTKDFEAMLELPTRNWNHKPKFLRRVEARQTEIVGETSTSQDLYVWTSDGTRPHLIRPKTGHVLAFKTQIRAKTRRGSLLSQAAQYGKPVFAQVVHHPGTEAREFPKAAKKDARQSMWVRMNLAMRLAARASGHGA